MFWFQIYLTRKGSRVHHPTRRAREPESTVVVQTGASEEKKLISNLQPYSHYDLAVSVFNSKGEGPLSETLLFMTPEGGEKEEKERKRQLQMQMMTAGVWEEGWMCDCDRVNNTNLEDN